MQPHTPSVPTCLGHIYLFISGVRFISDSSSILSQLRYVLFCYTFSNNLSAKTIKMYVVPKSIYFHTFFSFLYSSTPGIPLNVSHGQGHSHTFILIFLFKFSFRQTSKAEMYALASIQFHATFSLRFSFPIFISFSKLCIHFVIIAERQKEYIISF